MVHKKDLINRELNATIPPVDMMCPNSLSSQCECFQSYYARTQTIDMANDNTQLFIYP